MADKARLLAARALLRVSSGGFSNIVLDSMLEEGKEEVVQGVIERAMQNTKGTERLQARFFTECLSEG